MRPRAAPSPRKKAAYALAGAESGAWPAFDGPSAALATTDPALPTMLDALAENGHESRLLLGADTPIASALRSGAVPASLLESTARELVSVLGEHKVHAALVDNPTRAWAVPL